MVIDASALLAYLQDEPGADLVEDALLAESYLSCLTWTEVAGKLLGAGKAAHQVDEALSLLTAQLIPFDEVQMRLAAYFYARRRPYGLSLGDCATLALAEHLGVPALTAERAWAELPDLRVEVRLIRP
jgi:ribonuclease VapC